MVWRCLKTPFILRQPSVGSHLCDATRRIRVIWYAADLAGHGPGHRLYRICEGLRAVPALSQRPSGEAWIDMEFFSASISLSGKNGVFFWGKDRYQQVPDSDFATLELQECSQGGLEVPIHAGPARILAAAGHEHWGFNLSTATSHGLSGSEVHHVSWCEKPTVGDIRCGGLTDVQVHLKEVEAAR